LAPGNSLQEDEMIDHIDHIVLTTADEAACVGFYVDVLGMKLETFGANRKAFVFGKQKINLHVKGREFEPKAHLPVPGSLDLCFIAGIPLEQVIAKLREKGVAIVEGPVRRTGAAGPIESVYLRDPDLNLVEISEYIVA
jgi:catechol 2,3-dioxygenase-like lactoylglutathione lyase family enzyme